MILGRTIFIMNIQDSNWQAGSREAAPSRRAPHASELLSFRRERRDSGGALSPGHYLIRLRQYHAPGSALRKRQGFVTES